MKKECLFLDNIFICTYLTILLLLGIVAISLILTIIFEDRSVLDAFCMVTNAFTSNGYTVLGTSNIGKVDSLFLTWGGYLLFGVGTATLTAAILSKFFNNRFNAFKKDFIEEYNKVALQNPEKEYFIIGADVNKFKVINELFGPKVGDKLLKMMGQKLHQIFGENLLAGHLGGGIFIMVMENTTENLQRLYSTKSFDFTSIGILFPLL